MKYHDLLQKVRHKRREFFDEHYPNLQYNHDPGEYTITIALVAAAAGLDEKKAYEKLSSYLLSFENFEEDLEANYHYLIAHGIHLRYLAFYVQAIDHFLQANKIGHLLNESRLIASSFNLIATIYFSISELDKALLYTEKALEESKNTNDMSLIASIYVNLATSLTFKGAYNQATQAFLTAEEYFEKEENHSSNGNYIALLINMGLHYIKISQIENAETYLLKANKYIEEYRFYHYKLVLNCNLAKVYELKGEYKKALEYSNEYIILLREKYSRQEAFVTNHDDKKLKDNVELMSKQKNHYNKLLMRIDSMYDEFQTILSGQSERQAAIDKVKKALSDDKLLAYFQCKWSIKDNKYTGSEALVRLIDQDDQLVSPALFIDHIENHHIINEVSKVIIKQSLDLCQSVIASGLSEFQISINLSPYQIKNPDIIDYIEDQLKVYDLAPKHLKIEITERSFIDQDHETLDNIYKIKALGIQLALDDFGSGYSSLSYLNDIPFDVIKIDRSLIKKIPHDDIASRTLSGLIHMLKELRYEVVAEGVEEKEQVDFLKSVGCDAIQGFYYCKPKPASEILDELKQK
jgi:EAL domain-containing protein (putative c-di-GMP-specific phosphodiesterase class I)